MLQSRRIERSPSGRLAVAVYLWTAVLFYGAAGGEGPICVPLEDTSPRPGVTQVVDPNPASPGVVVETVCTNLAEPRVRVSVLPQLRPIVMWDNSTLEKLHFGYECEGSVNIARNLSLNLPRGLKNKWTIDDYGYNGDDALSLALGDTCFFFGCYEYRLTSIKDGSHRTAIYLFFLNGSSCIIDADECADDLAGCEQGCVDIKSGNRDSYNCTCRDGFSLSKDLHSCNDVDECETGEHNCDQMCTADGDSGWFNCSCRDGFTLDGDGHTCNDIDECKENGTMLCESEETGRECADTEGSYQCLCEDGFLFNLTQNNCTDIDECALNGSSLCQHSCVNIEGGYNCSCKTQWYTAGGPNNCTARDVCAEEPVSCGAHSSCVNSPDSDLGYSCVCDSGYRDDRGSCSSKGLVHVYWVCSLFLLLLSLLLFGGFFLLRHKYLQNKHDIQKRYNVLFRYGMKKEKVDPSYKPVDFSPMRKITYTFSLMSSLEMYGYPSHQSLHKACDEQDYELTAEQKLQPQNKQYLTPPSEEERTRRELRSIVEDKEDSFSDINIADSLFPVLESQSSEGDTKRSIPTDYVSEEQSTAPHQCPNMVQLSAEDGSDIDAPTASSGEDVTTRDGYVEEEMLQTTIASLQRAVDCACADEANLSARSEEGNGGNELFVENSNDYTTQEAHETHSSDSCVEMNEPDLTENTAGSGDEAEPPSPSEFSTDTVFSIQVAPIPRLKKPHALTTCDHTNSTSSGYGSEEGNTSGLSCKSRFLSTSSYVADLSTASCGLGTSSSGYTSEPGAPGNERGFLASQVSGNPPRMSHFASDGAWTHSDYVSNGDQCGPTGRDFVSEPLEPPLSSEDPLQRRSHQQPLPQTGSLPPGSYVDSVFSKEDPTPCCEDVPPDQLPPATVSGGSERHSHTSTGYVTCPLQNNQQQPVSGEPSGYVPYPLQNNQQQPVSGGESSGYVQYSTHTATNPPPASSHEVTPTFKDKLSTTTFPSTDSQYYTSHEEADTTASLDGPRDKDHLPIEEPISSGHMTQLYSADCESSLETAGPNLLNEEMSSSGYIQPTKLTFLLQRSHN